MSYKQQEWRKFASPFLLVPILIGKLNIWDVLAKII